MINKEDKQEHTEGTELRKNLSLFSPLPYRSRGIIHRERGGSSFPSSPQLTVNNSGVAMIEIYTLDLLSSLRTGFAARPGRRMSVAERSTFYRRASPPDGGFCPMTNTQNFSPASGRDEFYKGFAGRSQVGISDKPKHQTHE
jgi:hypothetical protein